MADARGHRVTIAIDADGAVFEVSGKTIEFPGYLRAYVEGSDDPDAELADKESVLPSVVAGDPLECRELETKSHTTQPPTRYSEASLTRTLEEKGIGRPSTYASIIDTILARKYVFKRGNSLVPTWVAFAVSQLLEAHLPDLIDYEFTAEMEDELDAISRGELGHLDYLKTFYFGNAHPGLKQQLEKKVDEIDARNVSRILVGKLEDDQGEELEVYVRIGRFGPFVQVGERQAGVPEDLPPDELTLDKIRELLDKASRGDEPLGVCPETNKPVFVKVGRFGPYVQRGSPDDDQKPQNASLLKGMQPEDVDLETALRLLSLPRELGPHPDSNQPVVAHSGRFGPYVKCGEETRSLPDEMSPLDVTLSQAVELLAQPKRQRGAGRAKEPIKVFDASPITGQPVKLLDGRYGPYLTDGTTNASLPRGVPPEGMTFERALDLLAERAARGPARRATKRKAAKKATEKAKTKKRAAAKKTPKKKSKKKTPKKTHDTQSTSKSRES
jgi:DNA topoisomerase-1